MEQIKLSVIVPVYREEENLHECSKQIKAALNGYAYEVVWVDDGSTDRSAEILKEIHASDPARNKVVLFRRNYGQTAAMSAGFNHAKGEVIVAQDADLQNDPRDIPKLLAKMDEGFDVVSGWRKNRKDNWLRKIPSRLANRLIGRVTGTTIHDYGCTLKAYNREILKDVNLYGEMHRFIPALAAAQGARVSEVVVNHRPRVAGVSKYGISRTFRVILDLLTIMFLSRFITKPLHFFGYLGMICFSLTGILAAFILFEKLNTDVYVHRNPLFIIMCMLFLSGFQLIMTGLLGEVMTRNYFESQNRTVYRVRSTLGF